MVGCIWDNTIIIGLGVRTSLHGTNVEKRLAALDNYNYRLLAFFAILPLPALVDFS